MAAFFSAIIETAIGPLTYVVTFIIGMRFGVVLCQRELNEIKSIADDLRETLKEHSNGTK